MLTGGEGNFIKIVSVYEPVAYTGAEPFAISAEYIQEMEKIGCEQATKFAGDAEELICARFGDSLVQVTTKVIKGAPGRAIVEEAQEWDADLIVMGSHGYGFWGRAFLGSISDKVIHHAPCSVLVVRKKTDTENDADK